MVDRDDYLDQDEADEVEAIEEAQRLRELRDRARLHTVLSTVAGRHVIWDILSQCGIFWNAPSGREEMCRFEGRRDLGIWLTKEIFTADPNAYTMMQREANVETETGKRDD